MLKDSTSVDFVIKDYTDIMSLFHVLRLGLNPLMHDCLKDKIKNADSKDCCINIYRVLKFQMKLSYIARS